MACTFIRRNVLFRKYFESPTTRLRRRIWFDGLVVSPFMCTWMWPTLIVWRCALTRIKILASHIKSDKKKQMAVRKSGIMGVKRQFSPGASAKTINSFCNYYVVAFLQGAKRIEPLGFCTLHPKFILLRGSLCFYQHL